MLNRGGGGAGGGGGGPFTPTSPAFNGVYFGTAQTNPGVVTYDAEDLDVLSEFNPATGVFTASPTISTWSLMRSPPTGPG